MDERHVHARHFSVMELRFSNFQLSASALSLAAFGANAYYELE